MSFDQSTTQARLRPRAEGANIGPWIGFKHFLYLAEEAVLNHLREHDLGLVTLFSQYGLGVRIIEARIGIPAKLTLDDEVTATTRVTPAEDGGLHCVVELTVSRERRSTVAARARLRIGLTNEAIADPVKPVPPKLQTYVVPAGQPATITTDIPRLPRSRGSNAAAWSTRIPYYYCHYSSRLSYSGYVRLLEDAVDRFLAGRGISVRTILDRENWVPIVSRASLRLKSDAAMEETLHTLFIVDDIVKNTLYRARMECYVQRGDTLIHTATATIVHGYVISRGPNVGQLVTLDNTTLAALRGDQT